MILFEDQELFLVSFMISLKRKLDAKRVKRNVKFCDCELKYRLGSFLRIYLEKIKNKVNSIYRMENKVKEMNINKFNAVLHALEYHLKNILKFFDNRSTNAKAESFNFKIKGFRANLRGFTDFTFFLFRLEKLFA